MKYQGYTHPAFLSSGVLMRFLWRSLCCSAGWHLWDEVLSSAPKEFGPVHYLSCDACGEQAGLWPDTDYFKSTWFMRMFWMTVFFFACGLVVGLIFGHEVIP